MKSFFSSHVSKFTGLLTLCALGIATLSVPVMANPIRNLQDEVSKRGKSPEDVNRAMRDKFPNSSFPYYEQVNGCSTEIKGFRLPVTYNLAFRGPCNNHDKCYATLGMLKRDCDDTFAAEMSRICEPAPSGLDTLCRGAAGGYYKAVDEFGQGSYDTAQRQQSAYIEAVYFWLSAKAFYTNYFVDTGILVSSGDKIKIRASGTIRFGLFAGSGGPMGIFFNPDYNYFIDVPHGRLMARFRQPGMQDLDGWFPVGEGWDQVREITLRSPGVLEFLVNDNNPEDNVGEFRVEVTLDSAGKLRVILR